MFRSPRTRRGKERRGNNSEGERERLGGDRRWVLYAFVLRNLVKEKSKHPEGAKMSNENRSARGEATRRMDVT